MTAKTTVSLGLGDAGLDDGCANHGCGGSAVSRRPRWFTGQLVGPADLESVQEWVLGRARRHNRMLHGWGISCGLAVTPTVAPASGEPVPWSLTVGAGYALSACGDEVSVPGPVVVDVRQPRPDAAAGCAPPVDPWCAPVRVRREPDRTYYLAVRYTEQHSVPVRAGACGCGCDDDPCEYSRIDEGCAFAILDELPDCYAPGERPEGTPVRPGTAGDPTDRQEAAACSPRMVELGTRPCPDCCSPWVVLADLRVDAGGTVTLNTRAHRRYVVSFGSFAFTCADERRDVVRRLSDAERDVVRQSFASSAEELATTGTPDALGSAPALSLRGATRSRPLRDLIGPRTVTELAQADVEGLRAAAAGTGASPEAVQQLHDLARLVIRIVRG